MLGCLPGAKPLPPFPLCSNGFLRSASHSPEWRGWTEGGAGWRGDGGSQKAGWRVGWRGADGVWRAGGPDGRLDGGRLGSVDGGMGLTTPEPKRTATRTAANRANRNRIKSHLKNRNEPKRNAALLMFAPTARQHLARSSGHHVLQIVFTIK